MSQYSVKLNGQPLVQKLDYQTAVQIASEMNGETVTRFGDRSIQQAASNLYEVSLTQTANSLRQSRYSNSSFLR
jgi:hypothetical protein